ncbi:hypothetical protein PAMA_016267 [Pampus argenteus]
MKHNNEALQLVIDRRNSVVEAPGVNCVFRPHPSPIIDKPRHDKIPLKHRHLRTHYTRHNVNSQKSQPLFRKRNGFPQSRLAYCQMCSKTNKAFCYRRGYSDLKKHNASCSFISSAFEEEAATDTYLVNDDPARGPGMPECFLVSDTYRICAFVTAVIE